MEIKLGFKAFDPHELLCHFIAQKAGLYEQENISVQLIDITFAPDEALPSGFFQASCGAALAAALKGASQRVVTVAVDRPMFWIYSADHVAGWTDLAERRFATFPAVAPPHHMANAILQMAGVDVARLELLPARDDVARLGLLKSGSVDAAVISSSISPVRIEQYGFNTLGFFGDKMRLPSTGLAIDEAFLNAEPELTATLAGIWRDGLDRIHRDSELVASVLEETFDVSPEISQATAELYRQNYTRTGQTTAEIAQAAIASMAKALNVAAPPAWDSIYLSI